MASVAGDSVVRDSMDRDSVDRDSVDRDSVVRDSVVRDEVQRSIDEVGVARSTVFASDDYAKMTDDRSGEHVPPLPEGMSP